MASSSDFFEIFSTEPGAPTGVSFARYMELAMYHPTAGYYTRDFKRVVRDDKAVFEPIKTGIAGEKYFEVISGLKDGDSVIVGPFSSVRNLADGATVKIEQAPRATGAPGR